MKTIKIYENVRGVTWYSLEREEDTVRAFILEYEEDDVEELLKTKSEIVFVLAALVVKQRERDSKEEIRKALL